MAFSAINFICWLSFTASLFAAVAYCQTLKEGLYRIENVADGLSVTTEGGNASFARVVLDNWQNFAEQKWEVQKFGESSYQLTPKKFRTNNGLTFYKDPSRKYPTPESWTLLPVQDRDYTFQIQNSRTLACLVTIGRRKELADSKCDRHVRNQHWKFYSI